MYPQLSDAQFNSLALIVIAFITAISSGLAAYWSRGAKKDSAEAKIDSAAARENSANALHEVSTNGGMSDPKPNLNDHVKYQTDMMEWTVRTIQSMDRKLNAQDRKLNDHIEHSRVMDQALAEVYMEVRPEVHEWPDDELPPKPPI